MIKKGIAEGAGVILLLFHRHFFSVCKYIAFDSLAGGGCALCYRRNENVEIGNKGLSIGVF